MPKVFITCKIRDIGVDLLRKKGFDVTENENANLTREQLKEVFSAYEAVIVSVDNYVNEEIINSASPALKVIANYAVGHDNIDVLAAKRKGIMVTNTPGVASESLAEFTFALILACAKRLVEADKYVRTGQYQKWDPQLFVSPQIWGKKIGIVGLGKSGTYVGNIAFSGFKMKVLYHDLERAEDFEMLTEAQFASLDQLLTSSDIVSLHVPLTPKTKHLIGKDQLKMMKKTAILINTSRGAVVDEVALIEALRNKELAYAGLDVFENEPNIAHELTTLSNVVLSPHIASATVETRDEMSKLVAENIIAVFEDKDPPGIIKG